MDKKYRFNYVQNALATIEAFMREGYQVTVQKETEPWPRESAHWYIVTVQDKQ